MVAACVGTSKQTTRSLRQGACDTGILSGFLCVCVCVGVRPCVEAIKEAARSVAGMTAVCLQLYKVLCQPSVLSEPLRASCTTALFRVD